MFFTIDSLSKDNPQKWVRGYANPLGTKAGEADDWETDLSLSGFIKGTSLDTTFPHGSRYQ